MDWIYDADATLTGTPSFKRCLDVDTGEVLSIHVNKLER